MVWLPSGSVPHLLSTVLWGAAGIGKTDKRVRREWPDIKQFPQGDLFPGDCEWSKYKRWHFWCIFSLLQHRIWNQNSKSQFQSYFCYLDFPSGSVGKESAYNAGDPGSIPGLGRSPREWKGYPLQYSGLENSMDCIVHGVTKSPTRSEQISLHLLTIVSLYS